MARGQGQRRLYQGTIPTLSAGAASASWQSPIAQRAPRSPLSLRAVQLEDICGALFLLATHLKPGLSLVLIEPADGPAEANQELGAVGT